MPIATTLDPDFRQGDSIRGAAPPTQSNQSPLKQSSRRKPESSAAMPIATTLDPDFRQGDSIRGAAPPTHINPPKPSSQRQSTPRFRVTLSHHPIFFYYLHHSPKPRRSHHDHPSR